jgi:hypothetical protein
MKVLLIAILAVSLLLSSIYIVGQINQSLPKMENPNILIKKKDRLQHFARFRA